MTHALSFHRNTLLPLLRVEDDARDGEGDEEGLVYFTGGFGEGQDEAVLVPLVDFVLPFGFQLLVVRREPVTDFCLPFLLRVVCWNCSQWFCLWIRPL